MAKSREAYVDTSALIALVDRSDTHHALFKRLFATPPPLITTVLVIAEVHGWFLRRYDQNRALQFISMIEEMRPLTVVDVRAKERIGAVNLLRQFADQSLTLADAVGLNVMSERKIKSCWSVDIHLGLTGVPLVIHSET
jgi:predicted nucleic acid-binding protein